ncbi:hypothetical protein ACS3SW_10740 [Roseobacteraceae bacterium S113]
MADETQYAHDQALLLVTLAPFDCAISDHAKAFSARERDDLTLAVRAWAKRVLSDVPENDLASSLNWEEFLFFGVQNDRTPGSISLMLINPTHPEQNDASATTVSLQRISPEEVET